MAATRSLAREALADVKRDAIAGAVRTLPDAWSLAIQYWRAHHRWPDLKAPKRFTEKIQWLKLHGDLADQWMWVDKVEAKKRVAALLGERWITPTLWHGTRLPPREERTWPTPYVIKANHGSGMYRHVRREADKDWAAIEKDCARWLRQTWRRELREHQYDAIPRQLLVEPRLGGDSDVLPYDYKFHVFGGRAEYIGVSMDRMSGLRVALVDRNWNAAPFATDSTNEEAPPPPRPPHFDEMLAGAELLGKAFPYARIDFYDLPDGPRFGEVTLTPSSGHKRFAPDEWDERVGALLVLPEMRATPPR